MLPGKGMGLPESQEGQKEEEAKHHHQDGRGCDSKVIQQLLLASFLFFIEKDVFYEECHCN
jgi:hypothetical protein